jgi:hypothetical protein
MTLGTNQFGLSVVNQSALTIGSGATDPIVFRHNISTTTNTASSNPVGMLENSVINATTTDKVIYIIILLIWSLFCNTFLKRSRINEIKK